jgi:SnoaL-like domain
LAQRRPCATCSGDQFASAEGRDATSGFYPVWCLATPRRPGLFAPGAYASRGLADCTAATSPTLFLPSFTSTSPRADGGVTVGTLEEFYQSQVRGFARATTMSESLEDVAIQQSGRLATAWADFVFHQDGTSRRGRLVLTLVDTGTAWRIASLLFSY